MGGRGVLKAVILNNRIEQKEKFKHNFRHDAMGDGQKDDDQVFALRRKNAENFFFNLCETCSG